MREAIGGSLLIYLIIPIIVIFIFFIGFIMKYASAYRAANYIVSQYENCSGQVGNCGTIDDDSIYAYVSKKYYYDGKITKQCLANGKDSSVVRFALPVEFYLPVLGKINTFNVVAETKTIHKYKCS